MKRLLIKLLRFYKKNISRGLGSNCIYTPTCSEYAIEALQKRSFFVAIFLIIRRLLRCNPFHKGGFDPVPDSKKVVKWLI
ncbi:MAG: membrane protein insertion efficiency factor YidD [Clostridia bacterium]|nr:membrane protein insertion efficiency factor YidD [Clostridia bacterium]MBQ4587152.1 membrane protein insertion efficiency factor YidD [Clostridia bacterium]MBQ6883016.1 membrane protein insertion efficiency factor YidD [Clostridia bacterium]MBR2933891.1 membrane protein insertion efficiency factor YidD [Clostridia bacterium]MBR6687396.1 membrane protein insertion efficiency factor YidD [Clostridia bacterium]